jgi:hypothetical protein
MSKIISKEEHDEIVKLCRQYAISDYEILSDGRLDVDGSVDMAGYKFTKLPLIFYRVSNNFYLDDSRITTLKGCPEIVGGNFNISSSHSLTSLEFGPTNVGQFDCSNCAITSLQHSPLEARFSINCFNTNITSLKYLGNTTLLHCGGLSLESLSGINDSVTRMTCRNASITSLKDLSNNIVDIRLYGCGGVTSLEGISNNIYVLGIRDCINLKSTKLSYTVDINDITITNCALPKEFDELENFKLLFKYQYYYDIWNDDGSLNKLGFADFLAEIAEGLL